MFEALTLVENEIDGKSKLSNASKVKVMLTLMWIFISTWYEPSESIQMKFTCNFSMVYCLQMDVEKWLQHLTAARSKAEQETTFEEVDGLINQLNLLSNALSMR